jgi:hypothetical protein
MFVPVDRPFLAVAGELEVHAAETTSVLRSTAKGRRLEPADRWRLACGGPAARLAAVAARHGDEPIVSPWPPNPSAVRRYGPACSACTEVAG